MGDCSAGIEADGNIPIALLGIDEMMQQFRVVCDGIRTQVESLISDEIDGGQA